MVGADRASGSGLDLQGYARYQNRSSVSHIWLMNLCLFFVGKGYCLPSVDFLFQVKVSEALKNNMKLVSIYAFKDDKRNTRKRCEICSKLKRKHQN